MPHSSCSGDPPLVTLSLVCAFVRKKDPELIVFASLSASDVEGQLQLQRDRSSVLFLFSCEVAKRLQPVPFRRLSLVRLKTKVDHVQCSFLRVLSRGPPLDFLGGAADIAGDY